MCMEACFLRWFTLSCNLSVPSTVCGWVFVLVGVYMCAHVSECMFCCSAISVHLLARLG